MKIKMQMVKAANKNGGDRYEATLDGGEQLVIYFPQSISRPGGKLVGYLDVTVEPAV